jgi:hypothetical protein
MGKRRTLLLLILLAFLAGSCYFPTPQHGDAYISQETFQFLQAGKTQRRDVLLQFGDPTERMQNDRFFVYAWELVHGYWVVAAAPGAGVIGGVSKIHYLCLEFAPDGNLKRFTHIAGLRKEEAFKKREKWIAEQ